MVAHEILITNAMKMKFTLLTLVVAMLSSVSLFAQDQRSASDYTNDRYDGQWPQDEGILYSYKDGLIIGTFADGKAEGVCVCYKPSGCAVNIYPFVGQIFTRTAMGVIYKFFFVFLVVGHRMTPFG